MKYSSILATLVILASLAAGGFAIGQTGGFKRGVISTEGTPTALASQGTVATDNSSAAVWIKTGGESTNGWVQIVTTNGYPVAVAQSTNAFTPVAGSFTTLTNGFRYYITATNGIDYLAGTNSAVWP